MSTHKLHTENFETYFCTITCYKWLPLFQEVDFYDAIYRWFSLLKQKNAHVLGYVIMPNHIHMLLFNANPQNTINRLIGNGKRFMAYNIVQKLEQNRNVKILEILKAGVQKSERRKGKKHQVFRLSFDAKKCYDESMIEQKLKYIHGNPVSGKWNLVSDFTDYIHSSASFYELGKKGIYEVLHYKAITCEFEESAFRNTQPEKTTTPSESPVRGSEVDYKPTETQRPLRETLSEVAKERGTLSDVKFAVTTPSESPARDSDLTPSFIESWQSTQQEFTIHTSGSTGTPKPIRITRKQMLASIEHTKNAFRLGRGDAALVCINTAYIGGMMMLARSLEIGMEMTIVKPTSNPFLDIEANKKFDFIALVPLQLEVILNSSHAPRLNHCKAIIIGGAAVNVHLLEKLQQVTAPIYATYGMTETVSHIAIKRLNGTEKEDVFTAFENINLSLDNRGCLMIEGAVTNHEKIITNDKVELLKDKQFKWLGRIDHVINSGGVKIQIEILERKIASIFNENGIHYPFFITSKIDKTLGEKVVLCVESERKPNVNEIIDCLKVNLARFEVPKEIIHQQVFARTDTGKVKRSI